MIVQLALQVCCGAIFRLTFQLPSHASTVICSLLAMLAFDTVSFMYCNNDEGVIDCLISR